MKATENHRDESQRHGTASQAPATLSLRRPIDRPTEPPVAKFIQICASRDDLFALDEEGNIYQYNFNAKTWIKLVESRSYEARA